MTVLFHRASEFGDDKLPSSRPCGIRTGLVRLYMLLIPLPCFVAVFIGIQ